MIVVDTSALVAIAEREPEKQQFLSVLDRSKVSYLSPINYVETGVVLIQRLLMADAAELVDWLSGLGVTQREDVELGAAALEPILQPQPLIGRGDLRELRADLAAVGEFELRNDVLELLPLGIGRLTAACKIFLLEVGARQPVILELEDFRYRTHEQTERVNVRAQVATVRVHLNKAGDRRLLLGILAAGRCGGRRHNTGVPSALRQRFTNRAVRRLRRAAALQAAKVAAPTGVYGIWIGQKLFVEGFKVGGIPFA